MSVLMIVLMAVALGLVVRRMQVQAAGRTGDVLPAKKSRATRSWLRLAVTLALAAVLMIAVGPGVAAVTFSSLAIIQLLLSAPPRAEGGSSHTPAS